MAYYNKYKKIVIRIRTRIMYKEDEEEKEHEK